ncbi:formate dehydrogenase major subunit [Saccharopolyspora kobensis]|uniref:Formate dehydrogenase major subunit n=1 Tax=Saccharopolyspora kobensis TaxID=146035 RepID=A0A1H5WX38_9PSEU|nr:formate dehydrogenase major subunit [Saccharopolyspora kobensis]SFD80649.1 formate dehydrogenase major subunit [Saccharopolyspora kobensis]
MPGLGTSFGRGGATTFQQDLVNADCILIQGSNMAEAHPVGFQWVVEAKRRGATVIHVDPRFTRTSALAHRHVPLRAGSDIAFLGALINHVLTSGAYFHDYVAAYTNAAMIVGEDFRDTEDLDGIFSGLDAEAGSYDTDSWQYEGSTAVPSVGGHGPEGPTNSHGPETTGSGGPVYHGRARSDPSLQHPRCVFQLLKRHYARYTPELVEEVCGVPRAEFEWVAEQLVANSGRDRTSAVVYSVGWTQHTVGVQYIRAASILQLLLGNVGRPGGGVLALRGHASIQGSTDIPTLFNLLPGYLPMPYAEADIDVDSYVAPDERARGYWANMRAYLVSLLKAWWGEHATADNDFCFDRLPRLTGDHSTFQTVIDQIEGRCRGYFVVGENPAVGSANARQQRLGLANLDWLVVRDLNLVETATFWQDGPEIDSGELRTEDIGTEVFFLPAAAHTEKDGTFTNTQRLLQWHHKAVEPTGDQRSDLWFFYHLGRRLREKAQDVERDRPLRELTWDYPTEGAIGEPSAAAVLREINGTGADGAPLSAYTQLRADGSTSCGCWIYCGVFADDVNQAARRRPGAEQSWVAPEWGWAWPANRRLLYNRASADPDGRPWSDRKAYIWWDDQRGEWTGHDVPDFDRTKRPDFVPAPEATGPEGIAGTEPFIMQSDGRGWLYAPSGLVDGPLPAHYEPQESPLNNRVHPAQQRNPARQVFARPDNRYQPSGLEPGSEVFPCVFTTFRLTEHHTAGGMSRWLAHLSELAPAMFLEISPQLAAERGLRHLDWATVITARSAIEGRVLVTARLRPLRLGERNVHQIGIPWHWGPNGLTTGDAANELINVALDPNVHIMETKAGACDIRPGRRPRGAALLRLVEDYRRRAGITEHTGVEHVDDPERGGR